MKRNIGVKKILVTFDLNCVIGYVAPVKNFKKENSMFMDYPPHKSEQGLNIWKRPNLDILFNTIFYEKKNIFDVGVWACQNKENTHFQINQLFGSLNYNLKFALFTKPPENYTGGLLPFPAKRDLKIIFDKFSEYNEKNTIVFTNYSNEISDYRENEIVIPLYHPEIGTTQFNQDAHMYYINEYLIFLNAHMAVNKGNCILF